MCACVNACVHVCVCVCVRRVRVRVRVRVSECDVWVGGCVGGCVHLSIYEKLKTMVSLEAKLNSFQLLTDK